MRRPPTAILTDTLVPDPSLFRSCQCLDGGVQRVDYVDRGAVDAGRGLVPQQVLGCDVEAVEVALGGLAEPGGRVGLLADQAGRGALGVVAGQHRLEDVGGGERPDPGRELGRASCRERVCQYVAIYVVDV